MTTAARTLTPFGFSHLLDMYETAPGTANDLSLHYDFLERLVTELGMTPMSTPNVIHGPRKWQDGTFIELFGDKAGVSGWIPLIESGIQIHSIEPTHFITLDVYSCKPFKKELVVSVAREFFKFGRHEDHFIARGWVYGQAGK